MSQATALAELDALIVEGVTAAGLSDEATFTHGSDDPVACTVLIDRNVSLQGELSQVVNDAVTVTVYRGAGDGCIGSVVPAGGDTFTVGSETFVVDQIIGKDESRFVCLVSPE